MLNHDIGVIRLRLSPARILPCLAAAARYDHDPSAAIVESREDARKRTSISVLDLLLPLLDLL
jgi:hypothetical protein